MHNYSTFIEQYHYFISRSLESQLYNKANEVQEDISGKRFDQMVAQIHLAAVRAQVGVTEKQNMTLLQITNINLLNLFQCGRSRFPYFFQLVSNVYV